jgi:hypothetical protein
LCDAVVNPLVSSSLPVNHLGSHRSSQMAALQAAKKYATLPPTVRTLASGVPNAPSLNLSARTSDAHGHGHADRSDSPSKWTGGYQLSSSGLINKSFATGKPLHHSLTLLQSRYFL